MAKKEIREESESSSEEEEEQVKSEAEEESSSEDEGNKSSSGEEEEEEEEEEEDEDDDDEKTSGDVASEEEDDEDDHKQKVDRMDVDEDDDDENGGNQQAHKVVKHFQPPANFRPFESSKVLFNGETLLNQDDTLKQDKYELWLFRVPKTFNTESLKNAKLSVPVSSGRSTVPLSHQKEITRVSTGKKEYSVMPAGEEVHQVQIVLPKKSKTDTKPKLRMVKNLPISRQFNLVEAIDVPEIDYDTIVNTPVPSKVPPPPPNMKISYLPIGAVGLDYDWKKDKLAVTPSKDKKKAKTKKELTNESSTTPKSQTTTPTKKIKHIETPLPIKQTPAGAEAAPSKKRKESAIKEEKKKEKKEEKTEQKKEKSKKTKSDESPPKKKTKKEKST